MLGFGVKYSGVERRGCAELPRYLSGAKDREAGVGVLWSQAAQGEGTLHVVDFQNHCTQ